MDTRETRVVASILAGVIVLAMVIASGILPYALLGGGGTAIIAFSVQLYRNDWRSFDDWRRFAPSAAIAGAVVAAVIACFGIASLVAPGWYKHIWPAS